MRVPNSTNGRVVAVLAALAVAAVGFNSAVDLHLGGARQGPLSPASGEGALWPVWPVLTGSAGLAVLLLWRAVRRRRRKGPPDWVEPLPEERANRVLVLGLVLATLTVPLLLIVAVRIAGSVDAGTPSRQTSPVHPSPPGKTPLQPQGTGLPVVDLTVLLLLCAAAITVAALVWSRGRQRAEVDLQDLVAAPDRELLADAVARAGQATWSGESNRRRVINAYSALEDHLVDQGVARGPAETPDELLGRLAVDHTLPTSDAAVLTEAFQRARFSSAAVTRRDVAAARRALLRIHDALARPR